MTARFEEMAREWIGDYVGDDEYIDDVHQATAALATLLVLVRAEALEEAAKVCDERARVTDFISSGEDRVCADAIRALIAADREQKEQKP